MRGKQSTMNEQLRELEIVPDFEGHMENADAAYTDRMTIMQINVGKLCNQECKHCHVEAGPGRTEVMSRDVMQACLDAYTTSGNFDTIDITGGAPEMNPNFEWFITEACGICDHVIVRTNLTILDTEKYGHFKEFYREKKIELFASLPYYSEKDTDRQRGDNVFEKSVKILRELNAIGYGEDDDLVLNLVYNPGGAFLPPEQFAMEREYKSKLKNNFGIDFTHLYAITNNPVGRFGKFLVKSGNIDRYMNTLYSAYNDAAEQGMMCRSQISVGYDGELYDCDFNQCVDLPIEGAHTVFEYRDKPLAKRHIKLANHCYACTAGQGSSCGGATE